MNTTIVLIVSILIVFLFFITFKVYRNVKNNGLKISNWYHLSMIILIPITSFVNLLTANYVLFYVEDYFIKNSYQITLVGLVITFIFLFLTLLFYVSAVDESLNNELNHEKVSFFEKLNLLFSIVFGKEEKKQTIINNIQK